MSFGAAAPAIAAPAAPAVAGGGGFNFGNFFSAIGGAFQSVMGARQQASQISAAAEARAAGYAANAQIAMMNAQAALDAGAEDKARRERIARSNIADTAVKYLASGVALEGSPLAVLGENTSNEFLEAKDLEHAGKVKANQYQNQAILNNFYAAQARAQGERESSAASRGGMMQAGQSLLGAFSSR